MFIVCACCLTRRGANINNILNFQKDYHDVKLYRLEQNYRSTKNIVNAANSIISHNKNKIEKVVWTSNVEGSKIKIQRCTTDADEGREVASQIFEMKMQEQRQNKELLDRAYDRVVSTQLSKLSAKKTYTEGIDKHHII